MRQNAGFHQAADIMIVDSVEGDEPPDPAGDGRLRQDLEQPGSQPHSPPIGVDGDLRDILVRPALISGHPDPAARRVERDDG